MTSAPSSTRRTLPDQLFVCYRHNRPEAGLLEAVGCAYGQLMLKPSGGLWTSPLLGEADSVFLQRIREHQRQEHWGDDNLWKLTPAPDLRLLVLDRPDDLRRCLGRKFQGLSFKRFDNRNFGSKLRLELALRQPSPIDWTALAEDYDGIWARGFIPPLWSCESVFWTRWVFTGVEQIEEKAA